MEKYTDLDRLPALVVYPQGEKDKSGTQRAWESAPYATTNDGDKDSQLVRDILAQLDRKYRIDHTRIYATGKSNGGGFAAKLACTMSESFVARESTLNTSPSLMVATIGRDRPTRRKVGKGRITTRFRPPTWCGTS